MSVIAKICGVLVLPLFPIVVLLDVVVWNRVTVKRSCVDTWGAWHRTFWR